jgi:hypothetical protein
MSQDLAVRAQEAGLAVKTNPFGLEGLEGITGKHLLPASLCVVQINSAAFIEAGVKACAVASTLTKQEVVDPVFILLHVAEKKFVYEGKGDDRKFAFVADGPNDPRLDGLTTEWIDGEKPAVEDTLIVLGLMDGSPIKIKLRGASGYPGGRKLVTLAASEWQKNQKQLYDVKYRFKTYKTTNKKGKAYYAADFDKAGYSTPEESAMAAGLAKSLRAQPVVADDDI